MGFHSLVTGIFLMLSLYLLLSYNHHVLGATESGTNSESAHRPRNRLFTRLSPRPLNQYARLKPIETFNDFIDEDDFFELPKRQTSDDYGHLRFGKRGEDQFDDYGHMRFGRSSVN